MTPPSRTPRVVLIAPKSGGNDYYFDFSLGSAYENLGLGYLASALSQAGFSATVLDAPATQLDRDAALAIMRNEQPRVVGLSLINETLQEGEDLAKLLKRQFPGVHISVGGHLPSNAASEVLSGCGAFDSAVIGFGEETFPELCERIANDRSLEGLPGVAYRTASGIVHNRRRLLSSDIDRIPFPDRSALRYKISQGWLPVARMITSRGCPYHCAYCTTPAFMDAHGLKGRHRWIPRSPENVVDEMEELVRQLGVKVVLFCDDEFVGGTEEGRDRVSNIARLIRERELSLHFWAMFRVDDFGPDDDQLIADLKHAGLWGVFLGIEAGSDGQLKTYRKGTSVAENRRALELFKHHNIVVEMGAITFHPEVSYDELLSTADFLLEVGEASLLRHFASQLVLYPGDGKLVQRLQKSGLLLPTFSYRNPSDYRFAVPQIGLWAKVLEESSDAFQRQDTIVWSARRVAQMLGDMVVVTEASSAGDLLAIRTELHRIDGLVGEANYQFFCEGVRDASAGANRSKLVSRLRHGFAHSERQVRMFAEPLRRLLDMRDEWDSLRDGDVMGLFYLSEAWADLSLSL